MTDMFSRWSDRKKKVSEEQVQPEAPAVDVPEDERPDEEILAELGFKDPDQMEAGDDFTAMLQAQLPDRIKQRALRKLWRTNPVLANLDGLCDYNDDFTDAAMCVPDMKTLYQVGKGMFREVMEVTEETSEADPADDGEGDVESPTEAEDAPLEEFPTETLDSPAAPVIFAEAQTEASVRPRHMRFIDDI